MQRKLPVVFLVILISGLGFLASRQTKAQSRESGVLDLSPKSCADFSAAQFHLDSALAGRNSGIASSKAELARVVIPGKSQEFVPWYASGGQQAMLAAGEACRAEMLAKSGEHESLRAGSYIAEQRARNAEFFANSLLRQYTGKSLY